MTLLKTVFKSNSEICGPTSCILAPLVCESRHILPPLGQQHSLTVLPLSWCCESFYIFKTGCFWVMRNVVRPVSATGKAINSSLGVKWSIAEWNIRWNDLISSLIVSLEAVEKDWKSKSIHSKYLFLWAEGWEGPSVINLLPGDQQSSQEQVTAQTGWRSSTHWPHYLPLLSGAFWWISHDVQKSPCSATLLRGPSTSTFPKHSCQYSSCFELFMSLTI